MPCFRPSSMTIKYTVQKTHLLVQERTKWRNSRLSTETPGYQLGYPGYPKIQFSFYVVKILWSQKFLTLSINIPTKKCSSHFFTILTGFPEIQPRPMKNYDFLVSKITKSNFPNFFITKSILIFYFKSKWQLFSAFFWGV